MAAIGDNPLHPHTSEAERADSSEALSKDMMEKIFELLDGQAQSACPPFGAEAWARVGLVVEEPELPAEIFDIMRSPSPYWPDQLVCQTSRLVLMPAGLSLNQLETTFDPGFSYLSDQVRDQHGDAAPEESYWVLMTRGVVPDSLNNDFARQPDLLVKGDELPHLYEAAALALLEVQETGTTLLGVDPLRHSRCQEEVDGLFCVSGYYAEGRGLTVCHFIPCPLDDFSHGFNIGIVACQRF